MRKNENRKFQIYASVRENRHFYAKIMRTLSLKSEASEK